MARDNTVVSVDKRKYRRLLGIVITDAPDLIVWVKRKSLNSLYWVILIHSYDSYILFFPFLKFKDFGA